MNYSKIKILLESKKITVKKLAEKIGISEIGLHKMMNNQSMRIDVIEKIAEFLEVPVSYFFEENPVPCEKTKTHNVIQNGNGINNNMSITLKNNEIDKLKTENEFLKKQVKDKEEIIELLKKK